LNNILVFSNFTIFFRFFSRFSPIFFLAKIILFECIIALLRAPNWPKTPHNTFFTTADQRSTYFRISHIFRFPHFFSISTLFFFNIYFFDGFHFIDAHPKLGQKTPQTPFFQVETGSTHVDPPIFRKNGVY